MLKTIRLSDKPAPNRNNISRWVSNKNNNSRSASKRNDGNNEVNWFGVDRNDIEYAKKLGKLFKSRKSKSEKMSKSWNLAKSRKNSSKSGNSTNLNTTEDGPKVLSPNAKTTFNCLWLAFTKVPIFWHFNPEYHIWIKTDALGYAIGGVLSQLTSRTSPNKVVIKSHLGQ